MSPPRLDEYLTAPLYTRPEVLARPTPVPAEPGVYGWWFRELPAKIDTTNCEKRDGLTLLYTGISPSRPPANGKPASRQNLCKRIQYHYRGNAEGSTLRKTLGCLLANQLGIELRRYGSGTRRHFGEGEYVPSQWMADNALVSWNIDGEPWVLEHEFIKYLDVPLNIDENAHNAFCDESRDTRRHAVQHANELRILMNPGRRARQVRSGSQALSFHLLARKSE